MFRGSTNGWGFWETSAYIGGFWIPALLAANTMRRAAPWIITAVVMYALAQGDAGLLWPLAHRLPVLSSLRLPSRFLIIFVLMVGMMAAWGLHWLSEYRSPYGGLIAIILVGACTFTTSRIGPPRLSDVLNNGWTPGITAREFTQISRGPDNNSMIIPALANHGVTHCYEYVDWPTSALGSDEPGYRGEQYLLGRGTVDLIHWTPNTLTFQIDTPTPTVLVVNQNYDRSWKLAEGAGSMINPGGLIGVRLPAGIERVVLAYRDWSVALGALISLATVALAILVARRERIRG